MNDKITETNIEADAVGARMSDNFIVLPRGASVREAMRLLVAGAAEHDNISTLFLTEDGGRLVGTLELQKLIIAREGTALESLVDPNFTYVFAGETVEEALDRLREADIDSVPVLDEAGRLCGVLQPQDVADLREEALEEDYARLAALSPEELSPRESFFSGVRRRIPWLIILLGLGLAVSSVVGLFEAVVRELTLIVSFQSLILGMAGNAGTQSLAVTIRELAEEEPSPRKLLAREAGTGLCNGLLLGVLSFVCIGTGLFLLGGQTPALAFSVSFCAGGALVLSVLLSSVCGTAVPLLFRRLGIDPAVASGPLITTASDLVAVVSYYGFAWLLFLQMPAL